MVKRDICQENALTQESSNLMAEEAAEETDLKKGKSLPTTEALLIGETTKSRASNRNQSHLGAMNLNGVTLLLLNLPLNNGILK